jgi:hypothetical protein
MESGQKGRRRYLEQISAAMADAVLSSLPETYWESATAVPLERLAGLWGARVLESFTGDVKKEELEDLAFLGLEGFSRKVVELGALLPENDSPRYEVATLGNTKRARFTLAHEISHIVLRERFESTEQRLSPTDREFVCNIIGRLRPYCFRSGYF